MMRRRLTLTVALLAVLFSHDPLRSQGVLKDARVLVDLPSPGGAVEVQVIYTVLPEASAREIPLSALVPEPMDLISLRAFLGNVELGPSDEGAFGLTEEGPPGFYLEKVRDHYLEGAARLPDVAGEDPGAHSLQFFYAVEGAWSEGGTATLSLIVPRWIPDEPNPETFIASVLVPAGYTITGSFPTSVRTRPPSGRAGPYQIGLQATPAMLVLRLEEGSGSTITLERGLDASVVLFLLVMGILGVRFLRGRET